MAESFSEQVSRLRQIVESDIETEWFDGRERAAIVAVLQSHHELLEVAQVLVDICNSGNVDAMHAICSAGSSVIAQARAAIANTEGR